MIFLVQDQLISIPDYLFNLLNYMLNMFNQILAFYESTMMVVQSTKVWAQSTLVVAPSIMVWALSEIKSGIITYYKLLSLLLLLGILVNFSSDSDSDSDFDYGHPVDPIFWDFDGPIILKERLKAERKAKAMQANGGNSNDDDDDKKKNNKKRKNNESDSDNNKKRKSNEEAADNNSDNLKPTNIRRFISEINKNKSNNDDRDNEDINKKPVKDKSVYVSTSSTNTRNNLGNVSDYRRVARQEWSKFYPGGRYNYIRDNAGGNLYHLDDRKLRDLYDKFIEISAKNPNLNLSWNKASQIYASSFDDKLLGNVKNGPSYDLLMYRLGYGYQLRSTNKYINLTRNVTLEQMRAYCNICDHAERCSDYRFNYVKSLNQLIRIYQFYNNK